MAKPKVPKLTLRFAKEHMRNLLTTDVLVHEVDALLTERGHTARSYVFRNMRSQASADPKKVFDRWAKPLRLTILSDVFPYTACWQGSAPFTLVTDQMRQQARTALADRPESFWESLVNEVEPNDENKESGQSAETDIDCCNHAHCESHQHQGQEQSI